MEAVLLTAWLFNVFLLLGHEYAIGSPDHQYDMVQFLFKAIQIIGSTNVYTPLILCEVHACHDTSNGQKQKHFRQ
jgi:hypothetical protein